MAEFRTDLGVIPDGLPEVTEHVSVIVAHSVGGEPRVELHLCRPTLDPSNVGGSGEKEFFVEPTIRL